MLTHHVRLLVLAPLPELTGLLGETLFFAHQNAHHHEVLDDVLGQILGVQQAFGVSARDGIHGSQTRRR